MYIGRKAYDIERSLEPRFFYAFAKSSMAEAKTNMDIPTKDEYHENPLYEKDVSINVQSSTVRTASDTVEKVAPVVVTEDTITQQGNSRREATLRLRAVAKTVSTEMASLNKIRTTSRKYRKHSTYSPSDISVAAIEGEPPVKNKWKRFWWAFLFISLILWEQFTCIWSMAGSAS